MQDSNGNGRPDDVWYELKGSQYNYTSGKHRYAITYFKPQLNDRSNIAWKDNEGNSGLQSGDYPYSVKGASITFVLSRLNDSFGLGYVDTGTIEFNIADAVQADGTPVDLAFIDFVKVQSACHDNSGTEMTAPEDTSIPPGGTISGAALGAGMHRFTFVNNSGQTVSFTVQDQSPFALESGATKILDLPYETRRWEIDTTEVATEVNGSVLTVTDIEGGDI
jgi:hypothetical protein